MVNHSGQRLTTMIGQLHNHSKWWHCKLTPLTVSTDCKWSVDITYKLSRIVQLCTLVKKPKIDCQ